MAAKKPTTEDFINLFQQRDEAQAEVTSMRRYGGKVKVKKYKVNEETGKVDPKSIEFSYSKEYTKAKKQWEKLEAKINKLKEKYPAEFERAELVANFDF